MARVNNGNPNIRPDPTNGGSQRSKGSGLAVSDTWAAKPAKKAQAKGKTFKDGKGNIRQIGSGKIIKAAPAPKPPKPADSTLINKDPKSPTYVKDNRQTVDGAKTFKGKKGVTRIGGSGLIKGMRESWKDFIKRTDPKRNPPKRAPEAVDENGQELPPV